MSTRVKIMLAVMTIVILCLGCALVSVMTTLGDPGETITPNAEVYEAPALNEVPTAEPAAPAQTNEFGWSDSEVDESLIYLDRMKGWLATWLNLLDDAISYNDQMANNPSMVFDGGWRAGYTATMNKWNAHADQCLGWSTPPEPLNEVDALIKQSCYSMKSSSGWLLKGLDGLPEDIDGFVFYIEMAITDIDNTNSFIEMATTRLSAITLQMDN